MILIRCQNSKASKALLKISYAHHKCTLYDVSIITLARRHNTGIIYICPHDDHTLSQVVNTQTYLNPPSPPIVSEVTKIKQHN